MGHLSFAALYAHILTHNAVLAELVTLLPREHQALLASRLRLDLSGAKEGEPIQALEPELSQIREGLMANWIATLERAPP